MEYKLVFFNEPASITFTNNQIKAENDEPVIVAILDATTNAIVCTGLLSSAKLEFFLVDGDYDGSGQQHQPLSPRHGKRPLMVGKDLNNLTLQNGVASLHSLSITDNSSWIKSNKFRLGVKIVRDDKILAMFPIIPLAVSQPFRVMDHQGEGNLSLYSSKLFDYAFAMWLIVLYCDFSIRIHHVDFKFVSICVSNKHNYIICVTDSFNNFCKFKTLILTPNFSRVTY